MHLLVFCGFLEGIRGRVSFYSGLLAVSFPSDNVHKETLAFVKELGGKEFQVEV